MWPFPSSKQKEGKFQFSLRYSSVCVLVFVVTCRAAAVRQELQAEVDQLPEAGPQEGELLAAGGGPHRRAPQGSWQQVILAS